MQLLLRQKSAVRPFQQDSIPAENPHFDPMRRFEETKTKQAWNP
jgi:hypothetical protein